MQEILNLLNQMSPYLLLGFGIAGVMHTFVPGHLYSRYLSGHGLQCNHCRSSVIRAVSSLPGTESVDADLASGSVTVTGTTPKDDIIRTIEALGFGVTR